MTKKIYSFLPKPDGYFACFTECEDGSYRLGFVEKIPVSYNHNIKVKDLAKSIWESREEKDVLEAIMPRPDWRPYDDLKTVCRVAYNSATIRAALDFIGVGRIWYTGKPSKWQKYFNLFDLLPEAKGNTKTAALIKLKEVMPGLEIDDVYAAETVLIGIYGIYELLKTTVNGVKDGRDNAD